MTKVLDLLNALIHFSIDHTIQGNKYIPSNIKIFLQNAHEKIYSLKLESQLQRDELQKGSHHYKLEFVQDNPLFHTKTKSHQIWQTNQVTEEADLHINRKFQPSLAKTIIKPWEELIHNNDTTVLGYDKDVPFHNQNYSKPFQFHSDGYLYDNSSSVVSNLTRLPQELQHNVKFEHCDRVAYMKDRFFDLHPWDSCLKTAHSSHKFFKNKPPTR